jgi:hypothetical protein
MERESVARVGGVENDPSDTDNSGTGVRKSDWCPNETGASDCTVFFGEDELVRDGEPADPPTSFGKTVYPRKNKIAVPITPIKTHTKSRNVSREGPGVWGRACEAEGVRGEEKEETPPVRFKSDRSLARVRIETSSSPLGGGGGTVRKD